LEEAVVDNTDLPMKLYRFIFEEFDATPPTWKRGRPDPGAWVVSKTIVSHSTGPEDNLNAVRNRFEKMLKK